MNPTRPRNCARERRYFPEMPATSKICIRHAQVREGDLQLRASSQNPLFALNINAAHSKTTRIESKKKTFQIPAKMSDFL